MKKLAFFSSSRSDFGLLLPLIRKACHFAEIHVLASGGHFAASQGMTIREVQEELKELQVRVIPLEFLLEGESPGAHGKSVAIGQASLSQWFATETYDAVVVLGDRWELFVASVPCLLHGIPIAHISGGEITEGAIDDVVRHAHTKMAHLHFAATEEYAENISRMGEEDWRITVCGECGLDSIHVQDLALPEEILAHFGIDLVEKGLLVTFHPATMDPEHSPEIQVQGMLDALGCFPQLPVIITAPGMEQGAAVIKGMLEAFCATQPRAKFVSHFGRRNYLTVLKNSLAVVGNSSSGLVEAASFGVPAVNIGSRQKNRLSAASVIHANYSCDDISAAIAKVVDPEFQTFAKTCLNPYDPYSDGRNSDRIIYAIIQALNENTPTAMLGKKFSTEIVPSQWGTLLKGFK